MGWCAFCPSLISHLLTVSPLLAQTHTLTFTQTHLYRHLWMSMWTWVRYIWECMDRDGWLTWKVSCCPELSAVAVVLSVDQCSLKSTDVLPLSWPSFTGCSSIVVRQERQRISSNVEAAQVHHLRKTTHMLIANRSNLENMFNWEGHSHYRKQSTAVQAVLFLCCTWGGETIWSRVGQGFFVLLHNCCLEQLLHKCKQQITCHCLVS